MEAPAKLYQRPEGKDGTEVQRKHESDYIIMHHHPYLGHPCHIPTYIMYRECREINTYNTSRLTIGSDIPVLLVPSYAHEARIAIAWTNLALVDHDLAALL